MSKRQERQEKEKCSKIQKSEKNPKNTYKIFFALFPILTNPSTKMFPILSLLSTAVEKTTYISCLDFENGPSKSFGPEYYM